MSNQVQNSNHPRADQSGEYLDDVKEWMEKRNVPGYYSGGKFPPHIKYFLKKYLVFEIIISAVFGLGLIVAYWFTRQVGLFALAALDLFVVIGFFLRLRNMKKNEVRR